MGSNLKLEAPKRMSYDVVIIGGAVMGASTAWFLSKNKNFNGSILVIERDTTYEFSATSRTHSCIRQQFSSELNIKISQFGAEFIQNLPKFMGNDPDVPELKIQNFGYMYLADTEARATALHKNHKIQVTAGAGTRLLTPDEIKAAYPFYRTDDLLLGSINTIDEGYFDSTVIFDWWRRQSRQQGVEYVANEVVAITRNAAGTRVDSVTLKSGDVIGCGQLVNATGARGALTARMAGINIPVQPRKRYSWVFAAEKPLDCNLPLTIDPSGVHVRQYGPATYLTGGAAENDPEEVAFDDFTVDHNVWLDRIWPAVAHRIPQFEAVRIQSEWAGHYDMNIFDHNAILGPHPDVENFIFLNGFSGHGIQQSPAVGRGIAEWLTFGEYRTIDLSPFAFSRIVANRRIVENAVI